MFERYYLPAVALAQCYRENPQKTPPMVSHLVSLPLRDLAIGLLGHQKAGVWRYHVPGVIKGLEPGVFLEKARDPVHQVLE